MGRLGIMQLPYSKAHQTYIEQIKIAEANLKDATTGEKDKALLALVQKRLDSLAQKYQYSEEVGTSRYKLYELQAFVHYFNGYDDDALVFINQAIEMHGETYARAEKLKNQLSPGDSYLSKTTNPDKMTKEQRRDQKVGLEGWLALFIVGTSLGILLGVINLFGYPSAFSDLTSIQSQAPDFVSTLTPALWFEILTNIGSVILAIWLIVLLAQHKKAAKTLAIVYLVSSALLFIVDYAWASSIFDSFNLSSGAQHEPSNAAKDTGRSISAAFIWVPYFLVSKRVKRTLIK